MNSRTRGFTLIEAAVAIAVVAILAGIIVPLVVKNLNDSRVARAKNDIQVIAAAIASQLKDTGQRPSQAGGPGGATGAAAAVWQTGPASAALFPTNTAPTNNNNTATNLFTNAGTLATTQTLFFGAAAAITVGNEFAYKGPYLGNDVALKMDPWNRRYLVLGYNANGQVGNTPVYVVCAGPDGVILNANWNGGVGPATGIWDVTTVNAAGDSRDDLWVRVN